MNTKPNNNGEMPAFPIARDMLTLIGVDGMTKRELIAMHCLQGILAAGAEPRINGRVFPHEEAARILADALLSELSRHPPQG